MITVLGSINIDLIGQVPKLPAPGETVLGSHLLAAPGGKGANQALAARRAGAKVRMIGATGEDPYAVQALELLSASEVDLTGIHRVKAPTGTAFVVVDPSGENQIAVMSGANQTITADMVGELVFDQHDVLLLQLEIPIAAMAPALTRAKQAGAKTVLNLAPFNANALPLARLADIVIVNEGECAALGKALALPSISVHDTAADIQERLGNKVVLTLGADGAMAFTQSARMIAAAPKVDAIDTVGAGDTFCGYLAAGLARTTGEINQEILQHATNAASLACRQTGAQTAMPFAADVQ